LNVIYATRTIVKSLLGVTLLAGISQAATSWTTPAGSTTSVDYSMGSTENGLLTDSSPTVSNDTFLFFPNNLTAEAPAGPTQVRDELSFVATAKPGLAIDRISAGLSGDWSLLGNAFVEATGELTITNLSNSQVRTQSLLFTPTFPQTAEEGTFTGEIDIDLPDGWTNVQITLAALVRTGSNSQNLIQLDEGFASTIQIKGADVNIHAIQAAPVPLPGALAAAPFAMGIAWYARRRMSK